MPPVCSKTVTLEPSLIGIIDATPDVPEIVGIEDRLVNRIERTPMHRVFLSTIDSFFFTIIPPVLILQCC